MTSYSKKGTISLCEIINVDLLVSLSDQFKLTF